MCLAEAELFHSNGRKDGTTDRVMDKQADEQIDVTKLLDASRNFANAPNQWIDCTESHSITAHWRWTTTAVRHKTVYMIDFKCSLILGDILVGDYIKINSKPVPCRVPADRLAMHLHNGWTTDSGTEHFFWAQVSNPTKISPHQVGTRKLRFQSSNCEHYEIT
jgi:hypothetical protein